MSFIFKMQSSFFVVLFSPAHENTSTAALTAVFQSMYRLNIAVCMDWGCTRRYVRNKNNISVWPQKWCRNHKFFIIKQHLNNFYILLFAIPSGPLWYFKSITAISDRCSKTSQWCFHISRTGGNLTVTHGFLHIHVKRTSLTERQTACCHNCVYIFN